MKTAFIQPSNMRGRTNKGGRRSLRPVPEGQSSASSSEVDTSDFSNSHGIPPSSRRSSFLTRLQEKEELQQLNDRLSQYIDYIQTRAIPSNFSFNLDDSLNYVKAKISELATVYTDELDALRAQLDGVALHLAEFRVQLASTESTRDTLQKLLLDAEAREARALDKITVMTEKLTRLESVSSDYQAMKSDRDDFSSQNAELRKQLEAETLLRTDLQNRLITTTEQISFLERLLKKEREVDCTAEIRVKLATAATEARRYRSKLKAVLDGCRTESIKQLESMKVGLEESFSSRLAIEENQTQTMEARLKQLSDDVERLNHLLGVRELELSNCRLELDQTRRQLAQGQLSDERKLQHCLTVERDHLIRLLEEKTREHADLLGIKVQLDAELAMYRKLLEAEEQRCNISPSSTSMSGRPIIITDDSLSAQPTTPPSAWKTRMSTMDTSVDLDVDLDEEHRHDVAPLISLRASAVGVDTPIAPVTRYRSATAGVDILEMTDTVADSSSLRITCSSDGPVHFSSVDPLHGLLCIHNASDLTVDLGGWHLHYGPTDHEDFATLHAFPSCQMLLPHSELRVSICTPEGHECERAISASRNDDQCPPPTLYVATTLPVWAWLQSVIALQDSVGTVQALCELEPIHAQQRSSDDQFDGANSTKETCSVM